MIEITIPGWGELRLSELVCDYNGTLARDGLLPDHVRSCFPRLAERLHIHVATGDTFGTVASELRGLPCSVDVMPHGGQAEAKANLVRRLGARRVVAIGNGRNDRLMLAESALGIGVMGREGISTDALHASHLVTSHVVDAFGLLLNPRRLVATLRG